MSKYMLIDAAHTEETRVAVVDGEKLDKYDFEVPSKAQVKGNIYLAKIIRVEPSLQAAFVDYGGDRHGFLSFSEIHHDYFQIPVGDREELERHIQNAIAAKVAEDGDSVEEIDPKEISKLRYQFHKRYKIQEVIKKRQIMLVQITKEERGNKGAALTTYVSLAGRYCVLMPNTSKGNGVSRKIAVHKDRSKLKEIVSSFKVENGSVVIRTAGVGHTKTEIKKDFDYLMNLWNEIRETTLKSTAPAIIHEEANLIKRSIRDLYTRDIESIVIEGEEGYKIAKNFVKKLMPSHSKKVKLYKDPKLPLFNKYKINDQINQIYSTRVDLPSGGYLVINTTEALISIDVNSGKATKERNISETAIKTNLEAAQEVARQCRLRDLAGLIVVDFIDMEDKKDNLSIERALRDALHDDKAKIQVGSISSFGLLEFSRQRLRSSITDANMIICPHCLGTGAIWSNEAIALQVLRRIEETAAALEPKELLITLTNDLAIYLLNNKRKFISNVEERTGCKISFKIDAYLSIADFKLEPKDSSEDIKKISDEEETSLPLKKIKSLNKKGIPLKKPKKIPIVEILATEDIDNEPQIPNGELKNSKTELKWSDNELQNQLEPDKSEPLVEELPAVFKAPKRRKSSRRKNPSDLITQVSEEAEIIDTQLETISDASHESKYEKKPKKKKKPNEKSIQTKESIANDYKSINVDFSPSFNIKDKRQALSKFAESYVAYEFFGKDATDPQTIALRNDGKKSWWQKFLKKNAADE